MYFETTTPIYLQLMEEIKTQIISGRLAPGERLLSVREWALKEQVNPNTMQKALTELESQGLIATARTSGRFVTTDVERIAEFRQKEARRLSDEFLLNMEKLAVSKEEVLAYLQSRKEK